MKKVLETILGIYSFILYFILSFLMHVITAYCVYDSYGAFLGIVAFFSPVVSTLIMVVIYTIFFGLFNGFNILVFIYLLLYVPLILLTVLIDKLDKKESKIKSNSQEQKYILWEKRLSAETAKELNDNESIYKEPDIIYENTAKNFCTNCGKKISENWNFCNHCGYKLK